MSNGGIRRVFGLVMTGVMLASMSATALADPVKTNPYTAGVIEDTRTVGVTLSRRAGDSQWMNANAHSYTAVKLLDLYKVMEADGTTQAVDASGNLVYQYRSALGSSMSPDLQTLLSSALTGSDATGKNHFKFDPQTGAITFADDSEITSDVVASIGARLGSNVNNTNAAFLAAAIAQQVVHDNIAGTTMALNAATELECGYYVIFESDLSADEDGTVATKPILLDVRKIAGESGINVTLKDAKVELEKVITNADTINQKQDTRAIGDTTSYRLTTNFPIYEANAINSFNVEGANPDQKMFVVKDILDDSLDIDSNSVVININGSPYSETEDRGSTTYVNYRKSISAHQIVVGFSQDFIMNHQGEAIVITYNAKLNKTAAYNSEHANKNAVRVTYANNPERQASTKSLLDETQVMTYAFDLRKLDGAYDTHLAGAKFQLLRNGQPMKFVVEGNKYIYDSTGTAAGAVDQIVTTSEDLMIIGLDSAETYTLREVETPDGYSLLARDATITIAANEGTNSELTLRRGQTVTGMLDGSATFTSNYAGILKDGEAAYADEDNTAASVKTGLSDVNLIVRNYKGIYLPETGSVTAIVLTGLGAATLIGGGAFIAAKKKKDDEE